MNLLLQSTIKRKFVLITFFIGLIAGQLTAVPAWIGNIISGSAPANFGAYWNQVTPENASKWDAVEGSRDVMSWGSVDTIYNYAKGRGIPFKFHCLVWGSQYPSWMNGLGSSDQLAEAQEWMQAVAARYTPDFIDVVNEPLHTKPAWRTALGGEGSTGWDWVIKAFQLARQYFGSSKLLINEYGIISDPNATSQYVTIINLLKQSNLVDGIGIQCHYFNMDNVSTSTMTSVLNTLKATGLPIYVSELDMDGDDATQASRYQEKFPILYNNVQGITLWGYIVGQTWASNTGLVSSGDVGATERPAMQWLKQYLNPSPTVAPTTAPTAAPACSLTGDVNGNGTVDIVDALLIAQLYVGLNPSGFNASCADVNCSGSVDIVDALLIAQLYVGLISNFPC
jgi:endo-1,4-beta-xylanase